MVVDNIQYGTTQIEYSLEFADRKTLGIKVHPDKSVQIIAPIDSDKNKIKEKIRKKARWIIKQQSFFLTFQPHTPPRRFVSGETHLYLGKQYRLKIITSSDEESVKLQGGNINIKVQSKTDTKRIEQLLNTWYKQKAITHFNSLFVEQLPLAKQFYDGIPTLKFRWMKKRWGSCDKDGVIHLNLELIKAPKLCIEYVISHELCHLAHLAHNAEFYELLEQISPNWQRTKYKLEKLMV